MGNPHAVLRVPDVATAPVTQLGPQIEKHPDFPQRCNVGFMEICDRSHIRCGSGNVVPEKPWPAAVMPVRRWWPGSAGERWTRPLL
jgi:Diaminopimelate epimerase